MGFSSVLVANRGEIARRILRTARSEGYRTVAVYSDADVDALHVRLADRSVRIGPAAARDSYLCADRIIEAARLSGAQAVHPGYGFLAENAAFAAACEQAGLVFIGPSAESIGLMGDKAAARQRMRAAGVPLLAGYDGEDQSDARLLKEADAIGVPLMIKAAAGGGGKGIRIVSDLDDLSEALAAVRRESLAAFGDDRLILERALIRPRHVEIQVLADLHGNVVALGERDCSIQRRHQKVVEEAPCPVLGSATRRAMNDVAVRITAELGYVGAGTIEFLLDSEGSFGFLEMNTRLQVEHAVTELITGLDLVAWQLRIAQGEALPFASDDVERSGHAIEVRLYAEDPGNGHLPSAGTIRRWEPPAGDGIRVDHALAAGMEVTSDYDPMLAKIIAHGRNREEARRRLVAALERTVLLGVVTNRTFLADVLRDPAFCSGEATTAFLDDVDLTTSAVPSHTQIAAIAALLYHEQVRLADERSPGLAGWTNAPYLQAVQRLEYRDLSFDVQISGSPTCATVTVRGDSTMAVSTVGDRIAIDGVAVDVDIIRGDDGDIWVRFPDLDLDLRDTLLLSNETTTPGGSGVIAAPMHGSVAAIFVTENQMVSAGQRMLVLEAMKMEHPILADIEGTVTEMVTAGSQVVTGEVLARIQPNQQTDQVSRA